MLKEVDRGGGRGWKGVVTDVRRGPPSFEGRRYEFTSGHM